MCEAFRALSREVFRTRGEIYCDALKLDVEREKDSIEPPRWMLLLLLF